MTAFMLTRILLNDLRVIDVHKMHNCEFCGEIESQCLTNEIMTESPPLKIRRCAWHYDRPQSDVI